MSATDLLAFDVAGDSTLVVRLSGAWKLHSGMPSGEALARELAARSPRRVSFDASGLQSWDSSVISFLTQASELCHQRQIEQDRQALPEGLRRLLDLAEAVPEKKGAARSEAEREPLLARLGNAAINFSESAADMLSFLGEATIALAKALAGRARFRRFDLVVLIQDCGADALPIVTLISFLVGTILAFVGAVQLQQFGAAIYVADLVGIAMVRGIVGGAAVGVGMLDLTVKTYSQETFAAVTIGQLVGGVFKASVYGILVAISGCLRGMQCGSSASAVGDAATSAVVTGIVFIVVACGVFAFLFNILGI